MGKLYIGNEYVPFTVKDERRPLQNYDGSEPLCIKVGGSNQNRFTATTALTSVDLPFLTELNNPTATEATGLLAKCFDSNTNLVTASFSKLKTINSPYALFQCFYDCTNLTTVSFPALTTIIGDSVFDEAFRNDTSLTTVSFPSLQSITGDSIFIDAFDGCESLESLYFPALTHIEGTNDHPFYDFGDCGSLESLHFRADKQAEFEQIMEISVHNLDVYYDL